MKPIVLKFTLGLCACLILSCCTPERDPQSTATKPGIHSIGDSTDTDTLFHLGEDTARKY